MTRGPWTATPALIKVIETVRINTYFYMQKIFKKLLNFMGKCTVCVQSLTFFVPKGSICNPIYQGQDVGL